MEPFSGILHNGSADGAARDNCMLYTLASVLNQPAVTSRRPILKSIILLFQTRSTLDFPFVTTVLSINQSIAYTIVDCYVDNLNFAILRPRSLRSKLDRKCQAM